MDDAERDRLLSELVRQNHALLAELRASKSGPASTGKTLRQLYELDERGWTNESWAPQMRATLSAALRFLGDRVADSITRAEWQSWRDDVRAKETTIRKGPPTPYTLNLEIKRWRTLLRRATEDGNCTTNPLLGLRPVRGAKKHRETEPTTDDLAALRPHCSPRLWAFVLLSFRRGLRASEARRLEWKQVDLERARVTLYAWQEKTRKAQSLRITSDVVEALRAIRPDVGRYVFPGRGGPVVATTLWREFRAAADAAGLEAAPGDRRVTFHDGRHHLASWAARKLPLPVAMRLMRHKSLNAAQRYIHTQERELDGAIDALEESTRKPPAHAGDTDSTGIYNPEQARSKPKP